MRRIRQGAQWRRGGRAKTLVRRTAVAEATKANWLMRRKRAMTRERELREVEEQ